MGISQVEFSVWLYFYFFKPMLWCNMTAHSFFHAVLQLSVFWMPNAHIFSSFINIFVSLQCSSWTNQVLLTASSKWGINNLLLDSLDCSSQNIHENQVTTRAGQNPAFLPHGKFHCFQLVSLCFEMKTHFCNVCNLGIEITNFTVLPGVKYNSPGHHSAAVTLRLAVITCLLTLCL